jgi:hypothetical protein
MECNQFADPTGKRWGLADGTRGAQRDKPVKDFID